MRSAGTALSPSSTWQSWTVVTTGVLSSTAPSSRRMPYSNSAKPSPLPKRAPLGETQLEPTTVFFDIKV